MRLGRRFAGLGLMIAAALAHTADVPAHKMNVVREQLFARWFFAARL